MSHKILSIVLLLASCLSIQSCLLNRDENDDCTLTAQPITDASLMSGYDNATGSQYWNRTAIYKIPRGVELYYSLGTCGPNDLQTNWEYTGDFEIERSTVTGSLTAKFYTSGTLCGQFVGNGKATAKACQEIKVLSDNVWANGPDYPGSNSINGITLKIGNEAYSGFGNTNEWYKLDTLDFSWKEKANISGPVSFGSFGGFSLNGKGYIVGNNSIVYEYDPNANTWTNIGNFPVNVADYLQLNVIPLKEYIYTVLGTAVGDKGYFGLGNAKRLWEFDGTTKTWTEKASSPDGHEFANHIFPYKNRIYVGDQYYDIASDQWVKHSNNFNYESGFGGGFVEIDGLIYGSHSGKTITYDGSTYSFYEPRPREPFEGYAPSNITGPGVVLGHVAIFPRPNIHPGIYSIEANTAVFIYRK
ncbi:MAG: hypothetical protein KF860_16385 [Cyclobacteriaceae bacterium]|nr:hypothetical protein [Cyclobacteriaceae bacterium]